MPENLSHHLVRIEADGITYEMLREDNGDIGLRIESGFEINHMSRSAALLIAHALQFLSETEE